MVLNRIAVSAVFIFLAAQATGGEAPPLPKPIAASEYKPPEGRNKEMQAFDKALLYLSMVQEADGHWDAAKSGAAPEFANANSDIALTALSTYALLCASQRKEQNRDATARARKALEWLLAKVRPDGGIADESGPGEPVVAQMFSAMVFMQAASMSTRETLRKAAISTTRYAMQKMASPSGGFGTAARADEMRADMTALGTFVFRSALMEDVKFTDQQPGVSATKEETEIENRLKAAVKIFSGDPPSADGSFSMSSRKADSNWDATASGVLAQVLLFVQPSKLAPSIKYLFKDRDDNTETYPDLMKQINWGKAGEGYKAMSVWHATLAIIYLYQEHTKEWKGWTAATYPMLLDKQAKDGGWEVAGEDAKRGRVWRTALHALTLILLAPAPPPAPPPNP